MSNSIVPRGPKRGPLNGMNWAATPEMWLQRAWVGAGFPSYRGSPSSMSWASLCMNKLLCRPDPEMPATVLACA